LTIAILKSTFGEFLIRNLSKIGLKECFYTLKETITKSNDIIQEFSAEYLQTIYEKSCLELASFNESE